MRKIASEKQLLEVEGGSLATFCAGFGLGVGAAVGFGMTLGPVGLGVVFLGLAACMTSDQSA